MELSDLANTGLAGVAVVSVVSIVIIVKGVFALIKNDMSHHSESNIRLAEKIEQFIDIVKDKIR